MLQNLEKSSKMLMIFVIFLMILAQVDMKMTITKKFEFIEQVNFEPSNGICLSYLSFNLWDNPISEYSKWYGLKGKSLTGKTYQTGHAFQLHVAVDGKCTLEQKQQNKTVFYDMYEFQAAASKIPAFCNVPDHTTFTYDYNGKFSNPADYMIGIDCKTGELRYFTEYFVQFKRATKNPQPNLQDYLNSDYVTIWTFYPKRT